MPYQLTDTIEFPDPAYAPPSGILAVGGDLKPERLLFAYEQGIFPWYSDDEPIIWWSPDPRFVLFPENLKVSKSMRQVLRRETFKITYDEVFPAVIKACAKVPRDGQSGTWITDEMVEAYIHLHKLGYAHSVEAWQHGKLVGGLYGISLGNAFFGESMFAKASNASKAAFITLVQALSSQGFEMIDCQMPTDHLASLGAETISRDQFLELLPGYVENETLQGDWGDLLKT
ncbi:MAG: leucyl/phenylalanyl-tRNA--protein transferase [Bacteroidia bacterium]